MKKYVKIHIMLFKNWKLLLKIIFDCMPNNTVFWNGFWGTNQLPPINYVQGASNSISILERTENPQNEKLSRHFRDYKEKKCEHYKGYSKLHVSCCDMSICLDESWKQPFRVFKFFLKYQLKPRLAPIQLSNAYVCQRK